MLINEFEGAEPAPGEFRFVTITETHDYDLVARLERRHFAERSQASQRGTSLIQIQTPSQAYVEDAHAVPGL